MRHVVVGRCVDEQRGHLVADGGGIAMVVAVHTGPRRTAHEGSGNVSLAKRRGRLSELNRIYCNPPGGRAYGSRAPASA